MPTNELPPENVEDSDALKGTIVPLDEYHVVSWSPGRLDEHLPPTQVHLILQVPEVGATFVLRLKSRRALDELIDTLHEHRAFTFGDRR